MTTSTQVIQRKRVFEVSPTRQRVIGIIEILLAALILLVFALNVSADVKTQFVMTPGGIEVGRMAIGLCPPS